ncbi:catalase family protein [Acidipila sp. EB88]|uniref:catalase family protein n=1 Tax=Acidipila sp. EB88 TaxID=2305226 RepID=UPI000F5F3481|nr:catalase family protein [Acidipila sp. EB88]RRA48094.1 catalase [Acidipila sp. EB88]
MSFLAEVAGHYLPYSDALETIEPDEHETFEKIAQLMGHGADTVHAKYKRPVRISHAKAHGVVRAKLRVAQELPPELAQGLFAKAGREYDVIVRLAHTPGELLDDRKVSTPRGIAMKILGVPGELLQYPGQENGAGAANQDFVFDTGKAFIAPGARSFLQAFKPNAEIAPHLSDTTKGVVSDLSRGTNAVLHAVGLNSGKLDFFGHPFLHPLSEQYYSQTPYRYGTYVAKFGILPTTPGLLALDNQAFEPKDENGLRTDVREFLAQHDAEYAFCVQLATDAEKMPIEDATAEWPEDVSPYRQVASLVIPRQDAYTPERAAYVEGLSFSPAHALAAHRPLGSLNRARLYAYTVLSAKRREELGAARREPASIDEVPA